MMNAYENPKIVIDLLTNLDVIATSEVGTETTPQGENDPIWDLNVG